LTEELDRERAALLTDPERMRAILQAELQAFDGDGVVIEDCAVVHTRYRTSAAQRRKGNPFLCVCYQLAVRDAARARRGVQFVHVRAYAGGDSARRFQQAQASPPCPPAFGCAAVAHLPRLDAVAWAFPNDPRLAHLREVVDPDAVRRHLPYDRLPAGAERAPVEVGIVRYKPEVRCITRYRLVGENQTLTLFGKTFAHAGAGEIARRMATLAGRLGDDPNAFVVPAPMGWTDSVRTVWQLGLPGTPLLDVLDETNQPALAGAAGRGLARLHAVEIEGLPRTALGDRLRATREQAAEVADAFPRLRARLEAIATRLEREAWFLPPAPEGLVHGDFLLKQLVVDGGRLGVFDFDNFSVGDPIQDLANCIADLHHQGLEPHRVNAIVAAFLAAYRAHARWDVPTERLRWHLALQLLYDAHYLHKRRHLTPGFEAELERVVALAEDPPIEDY
jgi:aminoglycoside phosphotransferase